MFKFSQGPVQTNVNTNVGSVRALPPGAMGSSQPTGPRGKQVATTDQLDRIKRAAAASSQAPSLGLRDSIELPTAERDAWTGIDASLPPEKLPPNATPYALNMRGDIRPSTLSTRFGLAALDMRGKVSENGLSIHDLYLRDGDDKALMLVATDDGGGNVTLSVDAQTCSAVPEGDMPFSPAVTLTGGSGDIQCEVVEPTIGERSKVLMRWSLTSYPESIYPLTDYLSGDGQEWEWSDSGDFDETKSGFSAGTYFVTVWIASRTGWSLPFYGKVVVS